MSHPDNGDDKKGQVYSGLDADTSFDPYDDISLSSSPISVSRSLSVLSSRLDFARRLYGGDPDSSFEGRRDYYQLLGYEKDLTLNHYRRRFERGGIAKTIVTTWPELTWSDGFEVYEDPDPEVITEFEAQVEELFTRLEFWSKCERLDVLAGIGHYGVFLIGTTDTDKLTVPLTRLSGPDSVTLLTPLGEDKASIDTYIDKESDPRFGLPEFYKVELGNDNKRLTLRVHHSRIFHYCDGNLESDLLGEPKLRPVWNLLDDLLKVEAGGAEAAWKRQDPGMQVDIPLFDDKGRIIKLTPKQKKEMDEEFEAYKQGERVIRTQGVGKINLLTSSVANFDSNVQSIISQISGVTGIPMRVFLGSERGELASTQDRLTLAERAKARKNKRAIPFVRRVIDTFINLGVLTAPSEYFVEPFDVDKITLQDQANIVERFARANQAQFLANGEIIVDPAEIRDVAMGFDPIEEEDVEEEDTATTDPNDIASQEAEIEALTASSQDLSISRLSSSLLSSSYISISTYSQEPEWKGIHKVADSLRPSMARGIRSLWSETGESLDEIALLSAIERKDDNAIRKTLQGLIDNLVSVSIPSIQSMVQDVIGDAGRVALRSSRSRGSWFVSRNSEGNDVDSKVASKVTRNRSTSPPSSSSFAMSFNETNPRVVTYALTRSSTLVTQITPDTLKGLQRIISQGALNGVPPRRQVQEIKEWIGLREDQVRTLENFTSRLLSAKPGGKVKAGNVTIKIPRKGVTTDFLNKEKDRYANRLLSQRALLISRTETMRSANEGQKELWRQAIDNELLPLDVKRVWIVTEDERLRESHLEMADQVTDIDKPFNPIPEPGSEPNCRCAQGLTEGDNNSTNIDLSL
jgi:hypothetical protein